MTSSNTVETSPRLCSDEFLASDVSIDFDTLATNCLKECESRTDEAFRMLEKKDEHLEKLQRRVNILEELASTLSDARFVPTLQLPKENAVSSIGGSLPPDPPTLQETTRTRKMASGDAQPVKAENEVLWGCETERPNDSTEDSASVLANLQQYNGQLRKALSCENQLRVRDRTRFIRVLDEVHSALKNIKSGPEITPCRMFVELASDWFKGKIPAEETVAEKPDEKSGNDCVEIGVGTSARSNNDVQDSSSPERCQLVEVAVGPSCSNLVDENSNQIQAASKTNNDDDDCDDKLVPTKPDCELLTKINVLKCDLQDLQTFMKTTQEKVLQEQRIQRSLQTAWSTRFKIHINNFQRLEKRYRRVSKCLLKFRRKLRKNKEQKVQENSSHKISDAVTEPENQDIQYSVQTERNNIIKTLLQDGKDQLINNKSKGAGLLEGRLRAAGTLISQQKKQIETLTKEKERLQQDLSNMKHRVFRTESNTAMSTALAEHKQKTFRNIELRNNEILGRYNSITREMLSLKIALDASQTQVNVLKDNCDAMEKEKQSLELELVEKDVQFQQQKSALTTQLEKEKKRTRHYEQRASECHNDFMRHVNVARERIMQANKKLREMFKTIQLLLELMYSPKLTESQLQQFENENVASSILHISAKDWKTFITPVDQHPQLQGWIHQCRRLMKKDLFAAELSEFLYSISIGVECPECSKSDHPATTS